MSIEADADRILRAMRHESWRSGKEIGDIVQIGSGRLYPALSHLEKGGMLVSSWEPAALGKKYRRRLYRITDAGEIFVDEEPPVVDSRLTIILYATAIASILGFAYLAYKAGWLW